VSDRSLEKQAMRRGQLKVIRVVLLFLGFAFFLWGLALSDLFKYYDLWQTWVLTLILPILCIGGFAFLKYTKVKDDDEDAPR
jgi:hypothetical protein